MNKYLWVCLKGKKEFASILKNNQKKKVVIIFRLFASNRYFIMLKKKNENLQNKLFYIKNELT